MLINPVIDQLSKSYTILTKAQANHRGYKKRTFDSVAFASAGRIKSSSQPLIWGFHIQWC